MFKSRKRITMLALVALMLSSLTLLYGATRSQAQSRLNAANRLYNELRRTRNISGRAKSYYNAGTRSLKNAKRYFNRRAYNTAYSASRSAIAHFNKAKQALKGGTVGTKGSGGVEVRISTIKRTLAARQRRYGRSARHRKTLRAAQTALRRAEQALQQARRHASEAQRHLNALR